jgi:hypothetical protein
LRRDRCCNDDGCYGGGDFLMLHGRLDGSGRWNAPMRI